MEETLHALNTLTEETPERALRIERLFADRPQILEAVLDARDRGISVGRITTTLNTTANVNLSEGAVRNYLRRHGRN